MPLDTIVNSPLRRAAATAEALAESHPHARRGVDARFMEMSFGTFEGQKRDAIKARRAVYATGATLAY